MSVLCCWLFFKASAQEYTYPLYFEVQDAAITLPPPELEYDLTEQEGRSLKIGNVTLNDSTFLIAVRTLEQLFPQLKTRLSRQELNTQVMILRWPKALLKSGTLEMLSKDGKVVWSTEIDTKIQEQWKEQVQKWVDLVKKGAKQPAVQSPLLNTQMGFLNPLAREIPLQGKSSFRFCLTQKVGRAQTKICSRRYATKGQGSQFVMGQVRYQAKPRVLVQNEESPLKGLVPVAPELPSIFYVEMTSGESYEFISPPPDLRLMDVTEVGTSGVLQVVGYETPPLQEYTILNPDSYSKLVEMIGFQPTIMDSRKFWSTAVSKSNLILYFPGKGGGIFRQQIEVQKLPRAENRLYLSRRTLPGTYIDGSVLYGKKKATAKVSSTEKAIKNDPKDNTLFTWSFMALKKGEINRSYMNVIDGNLKTRSYYELYRGYANELSGRFSGILSSGQSLVMSEVAFNRWIEDLFGFDNYWVAKQRWGLSFKYFKSMSKLKVAEPDTTAALDSMNFDIKYRLTPGLWTREESHGVMLSYQSVTFDQLKAPMAGIGWFWARSMPRSVDNLFNYLPFMRYPKWVDVEFVYYGASMDSNVSLGSNFALNFHGQVLWKSWFFGEAGFGMKKYSFTDSSLNQQAELNTFYGTVGMGLKF